MRKIKIKADTYRQDYNCRECKQNDDVLLEVTLCKNGINADLTDANVSLNWVKGDNTFVVISDMGITINNNIVTIELPRDCTRAPGEARFELIITDIASMQISTFPISIDVVSSVLGGQQVSKNVITVIEELKKMIELAKTEQNKKYTITTPMWGTINPTTLEYFYVLEHDLNSRNLHISTYENGVDKSIIGAEIIDEGHIKFISTNNNITDVILSSGYYGGYTSVKTETDITNIFNQLAKIDCGKW